MITLFLAGSFLIALLLGIVMIPNILLVSYRKRLFDLPDPRKVHTCPVPRLGGISFLPAIVITFALIMGFRILHGIPVENLPLSRTLYEFLFYIVGAMLLYLTGVQDDLIGVGYRRKFLIQILAALLLVGCGDWIRSLGGLFGIYDLPVWLGIPLTVFLVVYITNAINLIDGIDGLASGLCCISLAMLAYMHIYVGQYVYAFLALATLGILIPFWCYNVFGNAQKGHKLFMGDTGSLTLGYILSFLVIHLSFVHFDEVEHTNPSLAIALSTLIVPLFDVVRVVLHRVRTGKSPFLPDKNHFHHKLLRTGMRVRWVMVTILVISLFFIGLTLLLLPYCNVTYILIIDIILWIALHLYLDVLIARKRKAKEAALVTHES